MSDRRVLVAAAVGAVLLVAFIIVKNSGGGDDSSSGLTVCESAWREAQRSAARASEPNDPQVMAQPTLTACDTIAEWNAAKTRFGFRMADGAVAIDQLCTKLHVTTTPLCVEAKQKAAPPGP